MSNLYKQSFKQSCTENVALSIFNCGMQRCEAEYTWGPGIRDHYLIHMILKGKGIYRIGEKEYALKQGDLFLAKPNQLITYSADAEDPWEYAWLDLTEHLRTNWFHSFLFGKMLRCITAKILTKLVLNCCRFLKIAEQTLQMKLQW